MSPRSLAAHLVGNPRRWIVIGAILSLPLAWLCWHPDPSPQELRPPPAPADSQEPPTHTITATAEVFKKAFWKRPTAEDHILHAERREWSGEDGISRWQWFIAVQPSRQLTDYLWENNAFGLVPSTRADIRGSPKWFPKATPNLEVRRSLRGNMTLLLNRADNILYGTDDGGGFRPGTPESTVAKPVPRQNVNGGRLPLGQPLSPKP